MFFNASFQPLLERLRMKNRFFLFCISLSIVFQVNAQQTGIIRGVVRDAKTQAPIPGATVRILGADYVAIADSSGVYRIASLPTRTWNMEATAQGYRSAQKFDIPVTSGNTAEINFELEESYKELSTTFGSNYCL